MQRLQTRPQFQATMSGGTISRTPHFALHRLVLSSADVVKDAEPTGPGATLSEQAPQALFVVPGCQTPQVWLGALVPKRWAKRSVTRHTIKRQIYAVASEFDAQLQALPGLTASSSSVQRQSRSSVLCVPNCSNSWRMPRGVKARSLWRQPSLHRLLPQL